MTTEHFRLPAGWYADPESPGERWWNGSQWTSHTRNSTGGVSASPVSGRVGSSDPGLEGQSPTAWSAADSPLATVLDDTTSRPATADTGFQPYAGATPPPIAPGWYPDPQGLPAQRWWDGAGWSAHTAPAPGPVVSYPGGFQPGGYPAVHVPHGGTTVVMMRPQKSVGVALVLTFFLGPVGMFYSTVLGALVMLCVLVFGGMVVGLLTFGFGWLIWWPFVWVVSMIWGCVAAQRPAGPVVSHYR